MKSNDMQNSMFSEKNIAGIPNYVSDLAPIGKNTDIFFH